MVTNLLISVQNMSFWISGVVTVIVSCVGIVGNVLSLVVLCKKVRIKNNKNNNDLPCFLNHCFDQNLLPFSQVMFSMFNKLLICLCLADLMFLVSNIAVSPVSLQVCPGDRPAINLSFMLTAQIPWLYNTPMYHSLECVSHFSLSTSVFLTASCTVERHQVSWGHLINRILNCLMFKEKRQTELMSELLSDLKNLTSSTFN